MTHIFGHRWTSAFGENATDDAGDLTDTANTWATGLSGLTGEQIAKGLHACCQAKPDEWPSVPMFREKCMGKNLNEFGLDYVPEYYREAKTPLTRLLSSDERDAKREANRSHIDKMKEALGR